MKEEKKELRASLVCSTPISEDNHILRLATSKDAYKYTNFRPDHFNTPFKHAYTEELRV